MIKNLLAVTVSAFILTACGGSSDSGGDTSNGGGTAGGGGTSTGGTATGGGTTSGGNPAQLASLATQQMLQAA